MGGEQQGQLDSTRVEIRIRTKKDFGRALTDLRETAGLSVRDLARAVDVPSGTVGGWCSGRHLPTVAQQDLLLRLLEVCGVAQPAGRERWLETWRQLRRPLGVPTSGPSPYRGLQPFQREHADWFFGREELIATLVARICGPGHQPGPVVVVGASGSGKSSLLRAGLMATLCGGPGAGVGARAGHRSWHGVLVTPGPNPVAALAAELAMVGDAVLGDPTPETVEAVLRQDPGSYPARFRTADAPALLIVVDQFEEIVTACREPAERDAFVAALTALAAPAVPASGSVPTTAVRKTPQPVPERAVVRVVMGIRADFYPNALRWPALAGALETSQIVVGPMGEADLRQAIAGPARRAGLDLDEGLVHLLVHELAPAGPRTHPAAHDVSALPLLSHALLATWEHGRRRTMGIDDYVATGGLRSAVAQTADTLFTALAPSEQELTRRLFLRLVQVGENTPDTRRRVDLLELTGGPQDPRQDEVRQVLERYVGQRLLVADADGVEISHEALLRSWPRLREWIDTDRAGHRLHRQLTEASRSWSDTGHDPDALYRGVRLAAAVDWAGEAGRRDELNQSEQRFLDASLAAALAERTRERRRTRRARWLAACLALLVLIAGTSAVSSARARASAERQRRLAVSREIAGTAGRLRDSDPSLSAQLAVAAYRLAPTQEARSALIASSGTATATRMVRPGGGLQAVAVNAAGTLLAGAGAARSDTRVLLWDLRRPDRPVLVGTPLVGQHAPIYAVAFSPDGRTLVTGSADSTVRLWDVSDPARPAALGGPLTGPRDRILSVEFSPDGTMLAAGSRDRTVLLWDVHDRARPARLGGALRGAGGSVQSLSVRPDGRVLAAADAADAVRLWDLADRRRPRPLRAPLPVPTQVNTISFAPDGTRLAAGGNDGIVRIWKTADPTRPVPEATLAGTGWINALAFSADGRRLAVAGAEDGVRVWDVGRREIVLRLPHPEPANTVAFRDHDRALFTNSADGVARRWMVPGPVLSMTGRAVASIEFEPGHALLGDAGRDGQLWDLSDRDRPAPVGPRLTAPAGYDRLGSVLGISASARVLAANTHSRNAVLLWDIADPAHPVRLPSVLAGHTDFIEDLSFDPAGRILASSGQDGTVRLWDITVPRQPRSVATIEPGADVIREVAFTPDSRFLATADADGTVSLWDIHDPAHPTRAAPPLTVSHDYTYTVAISPDGRTLAAGSADGTARLWDITDITEPKPLGSPIVGADGYLQAVTFSPDSRRIAVGTGSGQVWIWDIENRSRPEAIAVLHAPDENKTVWNVAFSPDDRTLAAASGDITLWDVDPDRVAARVCTWSGSRISAAEWAKYAPGADYQDICS
ncbi:WD40 repeat [Frankia sp. AiPs1]|uniref:nSTAND1 domain-containing NTPase n=1 Tax=Frankia sp. AiPa1 TaxID=573492 RepID=UPI00202B1B57|nr:helix-turn-helix domain-containing protein [Frankia sp. AiPa1]MCL9760883.1 helix-turn-helix domain-containing protein [Frankia sp. AiPa1]